MKYIDRENLFDYAFLNEDTLQLPLRGICVCFHGYTDGTMYEKSPKEAEILGKAGIAWVFPYYSIWAWMSENSQAFNEQVLDAVYERLGAGDDVPLIISGGSMGGMTALNYLVTGKRRATACALNCPVSDLERIFADRRDFRRAIVSAHIEKEEALPEVLKRYSPVCFSQKLPKIPYFVVYGEADTYFAQTQMPPLSEQLKTQKLSHTLLLEEGMGHCDLAGHPKMHARYCDFIIQATK